MFQLPSVYNWYDGEGVHDAVIVPAGVAKRHAPLHVTSHGLSREYVYTGDEVRPLVPLIPLEAVTEVRSSD